MKLAKKLFQVEIKKSEDSVTGRMGLSWVAHCAEDFGFQKIVEKYYAGKKGSNRELEAYPKLMSGIMMMIDGGERAEDIEVLRADKGLLESLGWDSMNCADTTLNFLSKRRNNGRNRKINEDLVIEGLRRVEADELTYDNDTTFIDSEKDCAAWSYQKQRQMSGMIGSFVELGMINTVDYRPGNRSPQDGIYNQLCKAIGQAKKAGKRVANFRSDSAGYQEKIMTLCDTQKINWYITVDQNEGVKKVISRRKATDWKTMYGEHKDRHDTQWAEAKYVVSKGYKIRILILRWRNPNPDLFETSEYCYHVIGTNNWEIDPMEWLKFNDGRMGTIEHINGELKNGLGCNYTLSHDFEKSRGYFLLGVLAHNVAQMMKLFYLGSVALRWKMKRLRFRFIKVCGKITKSGRTFRCHVINVTNDIFELFRHCHTRLKLCCC